MRPTHTITTNDGIAEIETLLRRFTARTPSSRTVLRIASPQPEVFLRETWLALAVAAAMDSTDAFTLLSPGIKAWPVFADPDFDNDETPALSLAYLLTLQTGGTVVPDGNDALRLPLEVVKNLVSVRRGGLAGVGGRTQRLVEFDGTEPVAAALREHGDYVSAFKHVVVSMMRRVEVGAIARNIDEDLTAIGKSDLIDFLRELHSNGYAYARAAGAVRVLKFRKNLEAKDQALERATGFPLLRDYIAGQRQDRLNLIEASVSDFGPGILEGFRASEVGRGYDDWADDRLMDKLLHEQLSSNADDPNAGRGTVIAIGAARRIEGFVTLRTGRHWYVLDGSRHDAERMVPVPGEHPPVKGTHWTIIYPDALQS